jgi:hypothetical protein
MRSLTRVASAALMVASLVSGCSSSSNNKDGSSSNGPQPTTKLTDLTPTEKTQLCMQLSSNGSGAVSCPDAGAVATAIGICTSIQSDCTATVSTLETCTTKLMADACNYASYTADLATPECLVMLACTNSLCSNSFCFCPDNNSLTQCTTSCKTFTKGLTLDCATCAAGVFAGHLTCPDFTKLQSPYDQCAATCAAHGG